MKSIIRRWCCVLLALLLLSGCSVAGSRYSGADETRSEVPLSSTSSDPETTGALEAETLTESETAPEPGETEKPSDTSDPVEAPEEDRHPISLKTAFRWPDAPKEYLTDDAVAFYRLDEDGKPYAEILPIEELMTYVETAPPISRTHFFDEELPGDMEVFEAAITYALNNGCPKFCFPSTELNGVDIDRMPGLFPINGYWPTALNVKSFDLEDGGTLNYLQVAYTFSSLKKTWDRCQQGLDAARDLVDGMPKDYTDYQKAMYLYSWLTENVEYFDDDERAGMYYKTDWVLLYDTLINHETVCSGFTESLYYLFNLAGLDCITVSGSVGVKGQLDVGSHIWNMAALDGQYYMFDSTWDVGVPPSMYQFFAVSWQDMIDYYPRFFDREDAKNTEYVQRCTQTVLPSLAEDLFDDTDAFYASYNVIYIHSFLLETPLEFMMMAGSGTRFINAKELEDGWFHTSMDYEENLKAIHNMMEGYSDSDELLEFCLAKVVRESEGKLEYRNDNGLLRLTEIRKEGKKIVAVVCYIDEFGNLEQTFEVEIP